MVGAPWCPTRLEMSYLLTILSVPYSGFMSRFPPGDFRIRFTGARRLAIQKGDSRLRWRQPLLEERSRTGTLSAKTREERAVHETATAAAKAEKAGGPDRARRPLGRRFHPCCRWSS